jgi:hypothetical protein
VLAWQSPRNLITVSFLLPPITGIKSCKENAFTVGAGLAITSPGGRGGFDVPSSAFSASNDLVTFKAVYAKDGLYSCRCVPRVMMMMYDDDDDDCVGDEDKEGEQGRTGADASSV